MAILWGDVADFFGDDGLGKDFGGGTSGDIEVANGLAVAVKFISFGDVAGDADSSSSDLVTEAKVLFERTTRGKAINVNRQVLSFDPDVELLIVAHGEEGRKTTGAGRRAQRGARQQAQGAGQMGKTLDRVKGLKRQN